MIKNSAFFYIFENMAYYFNIIVFSFILCSLAYSSDSTNTKERLLFQPLLANPLESRVGSFYQFKENKLRLDIGASIDLIRIKKSNNDEIAFGSDFMNYTRLRHDGRLKFPVETADYFFGLNGSYKTRLADQQLSFRLRVAHISSHLIDGLADSLTFSKLPYVYSREFFDLVGAINFDKLRLYLGAIGVFSSLPKEANRFLPQFGFDYHYDIGNKFELVAGYDFKLLGSSNIYCGANALQIGILKLMSNNNGLFTGLYYYSGKSMHGMFYKDYDDYIGAGFQVFFY